MRRATLQTDALSHSALTGVALGVWLGITPLITTLLYTTICSVIVEHLRHFKRLSIDTLLSLFFSANLAIAIYLLSLSHGFTSNLNRYLFGSVTLIGQQDLYLLIIVCAVICLSTVIFWRHFWKVLIDEEGTKVAGAPVQLINIFLAILIGGGITASLTIVGLLLVGTLLVIPLLISGQAARSFRSTIVYAEIISVCTTLVGIIASYYSNIPASALITGILILLFLTVLGIKRFYRRVY